MKLKKLYSILFCLLFTSAANAEFYDCSFTEPFFSLYIATGSKNVTVSHFDKRSSYGTKIVSYKTKGFNRKITLENGKTIEIWRNVIGNDGMSERFYPFEVKFGNFWGGCNSEDTAMNTTIQRFVSFRAPLGLSFVNYWPGEYGHVSGYKTVQDATIPTSHTWESIRRATPDDLSCSLPKGKMIIPAKKKKNEIYAHLTPTSLVSKNENNRAEYVLSYAGEGFCLSETINGIDTRSCPDYKIETVKVDQNQMPLPPFGDYVFVKCQEGHYTWVHTDAFENNKSFEREFLGF